VRFEEEIKAICQQLLVCESETEAIALCQKIQSLTHAHVEEAREKAHLLPLLSVETETDAS
jgi:hypothetical protein